MADDPSIEISKVNPGASVLRPASPATAVPAESFHDHVSEFAANVAGSLSPFGDDVEFPLPPSHLSYEHPGPENRPALAGE
jgi:succinate dehydrogenase / fumarate reductase, iron-sulfur subunit